MRARRSIDIGKLAEATSRPGQDPRVWLSLAIVSELGLDPASGVYADVRLIPSGEPETCLVGSPYAGGGFGAYFPIQVDDTVLVAFPQGDPNWGPVIVSRMWNSGDMPPTDSELFGTDPEEPTDDVFVRVRTGQTMHIRTEDGDYSLAVGGSGGISLTVLGSGDVQVVAQGGGSVRVAAQGGDVAIESPGGTTRLGLASGALPVALAPLVEAAIATAVATAVAGHTHAVPALGTSANGVLLTVPVAVPSTAATKTEAT